jgi:hypothetical protein
VHAIHGRATELSGTVEVDVIDGRAGEHVFDIRDFGIKPPRILMLRVEPEVTVRIRLVAEPA